MLIELADGAALLLALSLLQGLIRFHWHGSQSIAPVLTGLLFGSIAIIAMMAPLQLAPGVTFDARSVILAMAGLFGGSVGGVIAAIMASAYLLLASGAGALVGVAVIFSCVVLGIAYRRSLLNRQLVPGFLPLLGFGTIVHLVCVGWSLALPAEIAERFFAEIAIPFVVLLTPVTALLGALLVKIHSLIEMGKALAESKERYQQLYDRSEVSIWDEDYSEVVAYLDKLRRNGIDDLRAYLKANPAETKTIADLVKVNQVNPATLKLYGAESQEELLGSIYDVFDPEAIEDYIDQLVAIWQGKQFFQSDTRQRKLSGEILDVHISMPLPETPEGYKRLPVSIFDITERQKAQAQLRESEHKYRKLVDSSPYCIHQIDAEGKLISMNAAGLRMLSLGDECEIIGAPYLDAVCDEDRERIAQLMDGALQGEPAHFEFRSPDGVEFASNFVPIHESEGRVDRLLGITQDITERKQAQELLRYQARHDALTGLINRHEFEQRTNRVLSSISKDRGEHAMCFLDLDRFKIINDSCGHPGGDELLRQIGRLLSGTVDSRDTLARLGGDEFGLLMEHCSLDRANRVAEEILSAITNYQFVWEGEVYRLGVSIGLVAITENTPNFIDLFKQADVACYLAKDLGRNRIQVYHPDDTELALRHDEMRWIGAIHRALEENRFTLYAQPIVGLEQGETRHYELLLRMLDEDGGIVAPGAFLPSAERYGLIEKLDVWVFENACAFLAQNPGFLERIDFVSINLSGPSLTNRHTLDTIMRIARQTSVPLQKICFEITETVAISNLEAASVFISILKHSDCRFALDDFGSGISSFGYLKNLAVDILKIDGMFVKDMVDDAIDYTMVKSINEIAQIMGMRTVGEFVENDAIKQKLKSLGVDYGQGFGLGKPAPLTDLAD